MALQLPATPAGVAAAITALIAGAASPSKTTGAARLEQADAVVTGDFAVIRALARGAKGQTLLGDSPAAEAEVSHFGVPCPSHAPG